jgi:putative tryptophan/tyrosine transport system substrate-binding protein
MKRREFIALLGGAAVAWPLAARAQQGGRGRRIAALMSMAANDPEAQPRVTAFESGMRELGWLDGRNLRIEYRWVSDSDLLRRDVAGLAGMPPDLILATGTPSMVALQEQGVSVPIVFVQVTDPVGQGLRGHPVSRLCVGPDKCGRAGRGREDLCGNRSVRLGEMADRPARGTDLEDVSA